MWHNCGPRIWGFWLIFPIIGFIFMTVMILVIFRLSRGGSKMCGFTKNESPENLKKIYIRELGI